MTTKKERVLWSSRKRRITWDDLPKRDRDDVLNAMNVDLEEWRQAIKYDAMHPDSADRPGEAKNRARAWRLAIAKLRARP